MDYLEKVRRVVILSELAAAIGVRRPRDLVRRKTANPKSRDGYVTRLERAGVVEVRGDSVALVEGWLEALEAERERGGEVVAEIHDIKQHKRDQDAYRNRHKHPADRAPTDAELAAQRERFEAALEAQREAKAAHRRARALEAFKAHESGAQKNLALLMNGEMHNVEYLVKAVMAYQRIPLHQWGLRLEEWYEPVIEAAAIIACEHSPPSPPAEPADDWRDHSLDCECERCLYPDQRYARMGGVA